MTKNVGKEDRTVPELIGSVSYETTCGESRKTHFSIILLMFLMTKNVEKEARPITVLTGGVSYDTKCR